jgi:hypothetical protein
MLDEGKITKREYEMVKAELLDAPADDWEEPVPVAIEADEQGEGELEAEIGWRALLADFPPIYRAAAVGALMVLVVGVFLAARDTATGSVRADPSSARTGWVASPAPDSLGVLLAELPDVWNEVGDPPSLDGGIRTSPEPGRLDSFLYQFQGGAVLAGAYDPMDGSVHALMARASLHDEVSSGLYTHLCHLLQPGSQACLDAFLQETGTFGKPHAELAGTDASLTWDLDGQVWEIVIDDDVETIRVRPASGQ